MAKLGKEKLIVRDKDDRMIQYSIEFVINVTKAGIFTTTISEEDAEMLMKAGVELRTNGRRNSRKGFYSSETKEGLIWAVKNDLKKCVERELIEDKIVIRYSFRTTAAFAFTEEKEIIPNYGWNRDGKPEKEHQYGTEMVHAHNKQPASIQFYAKAFHLGVYKYPNGETKKFYKPCRIDDERYALSWLNSVHCVTEPKLSKLNEIEYTEEVAMFFVNIYKSIYKLAYRIKEFQDPEKLILEIENKNNLLGQ